MRRQLIIIVASLMGFSCALYAQVAPLPGSVPTIPGDRSTYLGRPVTNPEALSGFWETSNGRGGAVGIHLMLTTSVPRELPALYGAAQSWQYLEFDVYERQGATIQLTEDNSFSDSPRGGKVSFEDGHLNVALGFPHH
jgi:hypothetical protein